MTIMASLDPKGSRS